MSGTGNENVVEKRDRRFALVDVIVKAVTVLLAMALVYGVLYGISIVCSALNVSDCEEAGRILGSRAEFHRMPSGVRDVCVVPTDRGLVVVQMR